MNPLNAILQHTALSALFCSWVRNTDFVRIAGANKIGNVKYFSFVMSLGCEINQEAHMMHRSHYDFGHNFRFHRLEWALHWSTAAADSLRQGLLLWVRIGTKKEGI